MALGEHDNLDELWPTRWAEQFDTAVARYSVAPADWDALAFTLMRWMAGGASTCGNYGSIVRALARCESPIERAFLGAAIIDWIRNEVCVWCGPSTQTWHHLERFVLFPPTEYMSQAYDGREPHKRMPRIVVYPQLTIGAYRVDFVVVWQPGFIVQRRECAQGESWPNIHRTMVIECDGHDYHERTKQQASADKARDRYMQAHGHLVFRFSGADIWRDPFGCAREAMDTLTKGAV